MNSLLHHSRIDIFADYYQFYVWDPKISKLKAPEDWTDKDVANRAKAAPGVVVICPVRNTTVPVDVGIWRSEPEVAFDAWQHIIEAPLSTTGSIQVHECTGGPAACFSVEPGEYTVRALFRGLDTLSEDGLEGKDFYEIQIWKSQCFDLRVVKQWNAK